MVFMNSLTGMPRRTRTFLKASSAICGFSAAACAAGRAWPSTPTTISIASPAPHNIVPRLSVISFPFPASRVFTPVCPDYTSGQDPCSNHRHRRCVQPEAGGELEMRLSLARSIVGLIVLLAFASVAHAQGSKLPGKDTMYNANRLKPDPTPGGPAPVRDVSGSWAGNLTPDRGEIPPLTPPGQKLFSMNKPETEVGTGHSNDPMNTCDPLGVPRNTVFETRGLAFGTMGPDRLVLLHQYQRGL